MRLLLLPAYSSTNRSLSHRQMLFKFYNVKLILCRRLLLLLHLHQWDTIDSTNAITVPQTNALPCSTNE
ncbi:hypothetical protein CEXT_797271 [Caerostris extrusa]|uniref:Uncharacterized protein n=1 Tax=Caerostris extrusa TaxID=172846 RepID=A0AAV4RG04_CAEEX|nr:hypothetical protein CEXT_797271 [Caerostris extrusa]